MNDDDIPDPTALREKLGISKPEKITVQRYVNDRIPEVIQAIRLGNKGLTLRDAEAEPREIDEAESLKIDEILKDLPPACGKWLKQYIILGNPSAASRAIKYSAGIQGHWKSAYPQFKAIFEFYHAEVRARWNEVMESRAIGGLEDTVYKPDGTVKHTRLRQDAQFMVQLMKKMDPEWKDDQLGTTINITVTREEE